MHLLLIPINEVDVCAKLCICFQKIILQYHSAFGLINILYTVKTEHFYMVLDTILQICSYGKRRKRTTIY